MSLLRTAGRVAVASSVHGNVQRRQQQRWAQPRQATSHGAPPAPTPPSVPAAPPPPAPEMSARIEHLKQLGELRDAGVLSDAEFEVQKAQLLQG